MVPTSELICASWAHNYEKIWTWILLNILFMCFFRVEGGHVFLHNSVKFALKKSMDGVYFLVFDLGDLIMWNESHVCPLSKMNFRYVTSCQPWSKKSFRYVIWSSRMSHLSPLVQKKFYYARDIWPDQVERVTCQPWSKVSFRYGCSCRGYREPSETENPVYNNKLSTWQNNKIQNGLHTPIGCI